MDWISRAIDLVVIAGLVAWAIWTAHHPRASEIVAPGASQWPSQKDFDVLAGKVKQISLEWEDTHDRLVRMGRSARASLKQLEARDARVSGGDGADGAVLADHAGVGTPPLTRASVLNEYRRKNATRQS